MCFNWDSSRLIAQMKKSHSCCCTTLRARRTVHHSSVTTINIQFALDKAWVLKLYLISCLLQPLTLLLSRLEVCSVLSTCMRGEIQPKVMFQGGKGFSRRPGGCAWCSTWGKRAAGATLSRNAREREGMQSKNGTNKKDLWVLVHSVALQLWQGQEKETAR